MGMSPRLLRPLATGSFKPDSISGIVHWWDANDSSTLTVSGGAVSEWRSKAGTLTKATQTTANNQPTTTTVNGKTAIRFDGANDGFDFTGTARTDETWIVVAEQLSDQGGYAGIISESGDGHGINAMKIGIQRAIDTSWGGFTIGTDRLLIKIADSGKMPALVFSVVRSAANGGFVFRDGAAVLGTSGETSFTTSSSIAIKSIGYYASFLWPFDGWIGEVLCWNRALSQSERLKVERYLGKKWGITVA